MIQAALKPEGRGVCSLRKKLIYLTYSGVYLDGRLQRTIKLKNVENFKENVPCSRECVILFQTRNRFLLINTGENTIIRLVGVNFIIIKEGCME